MSLSLQLLVQNLLVSCKCILSGKFHVHSNNCNFLTSSSNFLTRATRVCLKNISFSIIHGSTILCCCRFLIFEILFLTPDKLRNFCSILTFEINIVFPLILFLNVFIVESIITVLSQLYQLIVKSVNLRLHLCTLLIHYLSLIREISCNISN